MTTSYIEEDLGKKLDNISLSTKSGAKIGVMLAINPVTSVITTGALVGGGILYGTYKVAKRLIG